ncbi:hypothetical protein ACIQYZ_13560 [Rhodococcus erythropolis]
MTEADDASGSGAAALDYEALAAEVAAEVTGPRGRAPELSAVTESLRRRAAGEAYPAIASAIGVSAKRAASWCRTAQRIDARFDAREAKPRRARAGGRPASTMFSARIEADLVALVRGRAASEGRSVTSVVESALRGYVGRKVAGVETLVRRELRKRLKEELRELSASVGALSMELRRQGSNLNQIAAFVNRYRELPVSIADELAATRRALEVNEAALERLHAAVLARYEDEEG